MIDPDTLKQLRKALQGQSLLYVEDNIGLNSQASQLFSKIFETVYSAFDGEEGLKLFEEHRPPFVITDIKMPKMDGIEMSSTILSTHPDTKVIFTTAHNDNELLHQAIRIGITDYLVKPINIQDVLQILLKCMKDIRASMHANLFNSYLHNIFNYQQNLVLLLSDGKAVMANQRCLDFFNLPDVQRMNEHFENFGELLLEHSGFLYNHENIEWFETLQKNPGKLFNVKIADEQGENHHFVINLQPVPEKPDYAILSLNDVTELNLLKLFDPKAVEQEAVQKDKKALLGLFEMAKRNNAKIKIYNLYKGLSITNEGLIDEAEPDRLVIRTSFMQLKAIQIEKKVILASDIFPLFVECSDIRKINFDTQYVEFGAFKMASTSPTRRQYIRVPPDEHARATLLYQKHKFDTDIAIADISIKATRLLLSNLPAGMQEGSEVIIDMVLGNPQHFLIINTEAKVFRILEKGRQFEVVFEYNLHHQVHKQLIDYIAKRQMNLIREFKAMQYGE